MTPIAFERWGSGFPVVLVHGLGSRRQVFDPIIAGLAARHEVIAIDLPGFGASPPDPTVTPSAPGYAARLAELFAELGIERPHVVGNALGGGVALELGRSGVAEQVTAFSPIGFWHTPGRIWCQGLVTSLRTVARLAEPVLEPLMNNRVTRAALLATMYGHPTTVAPEVALADARRLVGATTFPEARHEFTGYHFGSVGELAQIRTTIAWGTRDIVLTHRTQSRRARAALPFARHVDLPGCGHLPFQDDPELCQGVVLGE